MGIFVVFLFSPCRAWWPVGNGRGKWGWKRWKGEEKSGHCLRASFSMHFPGRGWCWQHNSRMTWQLMGEKRGRMEMCLWEGFICQWALSWTDWKSLSFFPSHSHSFLFQPSLTVPSCGQFGAEGLEDAVIQKSCLLKLCVPVTPSFVLLCDCQSACVCVSECIQFSFSPVLSFCVWKCLSPGKFYSTFMGQTDTTFFNLQDFPQYFFETRLSKCYLK